MQKSWEHKKTVKSPVAFYTFGSAHLKAAHKTLVNLSPQFLNDTFQVEWRLFMLHRAIGYVSYDYFRVTLDHFWSERHLMKQLGQQIKIGFKS